VGNAFLSTCSCNQFSCAAPTSPWSSKDYRFCGSCPSFLEGAWHHSCTHCAPTGTELQVTCPNAWEACDVFVFVHSHCGGETNGGLPYNLLGEDWVAGSCGPKFCLSFNATCQTPTNNSVVQPGDTHIRWTMTLFHKQWQGGDMITVPQLASETMYFTMMIKEGSWCADKTEAECLLEPGLCKWDATATSCNAVVCPAPAPGPPPPAVPPTCCDVAPGVESGNCSATEITSVCNFNLPVC